MVMNNTFKKILNPPNPLFQRGNHSFAKKGFKTLRLIIWLLICFAFIGCGSDEHFDTQDSVPIEKPNSLMAIDLPSAEGDSWEYATPDGENPYTVKVSGTKNIGGYTVRILEVGFVFLFNVSQEFYTELDEGIISEKLIQKFADNNITLSQNAIVRIKNESNEWRIDNGQQVYIIKKEEDELNIYDSNTPIDYTGAVYGLPVRYYLFTKDLEAYTEYAFELWVDFLDDTYFQRYLPKRIAWSFPLYEGKEWIVSTLYTEPKFTYTRKVLSANETVTIPTGTYSGVFRVEESVSTDTQQDSGLISVYWLAKSVGVIKYQYIDSASLNPITYELRKFKKG